MLKVVSRDEFLRQIELNLLRTAINCIHVGAAFRFRNLFLCSYKIARHFHDLAGHLVKKRDCPIKIGTIGRSVDQIFSNEYDHFLEVSHVPL